MGQLIGNRYEVRHLIGHGAMGQVYLGLDRDTELEVAIKELRPEFTTQDPDLVTRFEREGEVLRRLNHPNIVKTYGTFKEKDRHYIVMDYVSGGSIRDLIRSQSPLPISNVIDIGIELSDALARVHHLAIIHRDIKPANVLLDTDGTPRLTDFGVAHVTDETSLTQTGYVFGTYAYVSPEGCYGANIDARTDIWSFGVLLYEMMVGTVPFNETSPAAIVTAILSQPVPDILKLRPDTPEAFANLIYQMLQKDPEKRIDSARKVGTVLESILRGGVIDLPTASVASTGDAYLPDDTYTPAKPAHFGVPSPIQHNLPAQATPFIGRNTELSDIVFTLRDEKCRLLTLHGAGGIGKTRLAIEAGQRLLSDFKDGVYFVGLAPVSSDEFVLQAVADAVGFTFYGAAAQHRSLLINYLREKNMLIIMDNFEHVLDAVDLVDEILNTAPKLKMIATSRESLSLHQEWIHRVSGMSYPDDADTASFESYSAVRLFIDGARRVKSDFDMEADRACILQVLRLVDGLPLGIELATAWLRLLSCEQIVGEIQTNLDFLASNLRNVAERHRSLRAVFEYSWALMTETEQATLARLSVFKGGFDRQAAEIVGDTSLMTLINLVDKSMLQRVGSERYDMHLLIQQYAAEKLREDEEIAHQTQNVHSSFYLVYVAKYEKDMKGANQKAALAAIDLEIDNVRTAWNWALDQQRYDDLLSAMFPYYIFYSLRNWFIEGEELFLHAVNTLDEFPSTTQRDLALGRLLGLYASTIATTDAHPYLFRSRELLENLIENGITEARPALKITFHYLGRDLTDPDQRLMYLHESLEISREIDDKWGVMITYNSLGDYYWQQGDMEQSKAYYLKAKAIGHELGNQLEMGYGLNAMGNIGWTTGDYEMGKAAYQEALEIFKAFGSKGQWALGVFNLADIYLDEGDLDRAEQAYETCLEIGRPIGFYGVEIWSLARLARIERLRGNSHKAMRLLHQSIDVAENVAEYPVPPDTLRELGYVALENGNLPEARRYFRQVAELMHDHRIPLYKVEMCQGFAELAIAENDLPTAAQIIALMIHHPSSRQIVRDRGRELLARIEDQLDPVLRDQIESGTNLTPIDIFIENIIGD